MCIRDSLYTHLGKRRPAAMQDTNHFPQHTEAAFRDLKRRYAGGEIMLSPVSRMLDYIVLRDHIRVDRAQRIIRFTADGIAFEHTGAIELRGHAFTLQGLGTEGPSFKVVGTDGGLQPGVEQHDANTFTLHFS